MGLFITFEGGEGCGKSTQARYLYNTIQQLNLPALLTYEPGGTELGKEIRDLLKRKRTSSVLPMAELLLFNASRVQLVNEVIRPALEQGKIVICDRFTDSTLVYQGYARNLGTTMVSEINKLATGNILPDITFLLDVSPPTGLNRKSTAPDRFEEEDASFHKTVREGYHELASREPDRWTVIDGSLPKNVISELIWDKVRQKLHCTGINIEDEKKESGNSAKRGC